jgi:NADPH-dependent 2,4-dienoyl-CoA reductase/sulfur reductase-like enzyme
MSEKTAIVPSLAPVSDYADIVIIGNGIAGLTAAMEARRLAPDTSVVIISEQCHPTIHTPALKQFALGKLAQEQLLAYPAGTERSQRLHVVNARVEGINAESKYLTLQGIRHFGYGSLLIATGSRPNSLPADLPGRGFDGVITLHNLHDYLDFRRRLPEVEEAVVIGGGAHAVETIMVLRHHGVAVHWLIRGEVFLSKMLDRTASEIVLAHIRHLGVKIYTRTEALGIVGRVGSVIGVVTNHQKMIPCQMVLACTGTTPVMTLAKNCTIPIMHKQGILVDEQFRTNVPYIYAAGDVAAYKDPQTGAYETHAQWYAAVQQGRIAAAAMTGHYDPALHAVGVSWHATHLGELCMLTVGSPLQNIRGAVVLKDKSKRRYSRMSVVSDMLVGYLSLGQMQPDSLAIKRLIDERVSIRGIKDALLKGSFDARKYLSEHQSRTMQQLITSGHLPAIAPPRHITPLPPSRPVIPAMQRAMPRMVRAQGSFPQWQPAPEPPASAQLPRQSRQTDPLEEASPFMLRVYEQPTIHGGEASPTFQPAAGEVVIPAEKIVESMLVPLPARSNSRGLWSYSRKLPVVQAKTTRSDTTRLPQPEETTGQDQAHTSAGKTPAARENFLL